MPVNTRYSSKHFAMQTKGIIFSLIFISFFFSGLKADSPLTSTPFYTVYSDVPEVNAATLANGLTPEAIRFLEGDAAVDQKMALINALGWGKTDLVLTYREHLGKKYKLDAAFFDSILQYRGDNPDTYPGTEKLSQDELLNLAYLQAMGNYFEPLKAHYTAWQSFNRGATRTHAIIYGLIVAQYNLDLNWCYVYQVMVQVRDEPLITEENLRQEALDIIFEYINLYASECVTEDVADEEYNLYELVQPKPEYVSWGQQSNNGKKDFSDLMVEEILAPEYIDEFQGTRVRVIIKNTGTAGSYPTLARLKDVDLSKAEAKTYGLKGVELEIAGELERTQLDPTQEDNYFESWCFIPPVEPGKRYVIEFFIYGLWIYDPNCEIKVELDTENVIEEPNEKNNVKIFVAWG